MLRRALIAFCLIVGLVSLAHAQGVSVSGQAIVNTPTSVSGIPGNTVLQAIPGAQITVCSSAGGGIPCAPLVTIYSNSLLTVVAPNPFTADANGNFQFFVAPNSTGYLYSQTGNGIVGQLFTILPQTTVGAGGGGTPAGAFNTVQFNNAGAFGGAAGVTTDGNSLHVKGPIPWADITTFGGRATASSLSTTGSCIGTTTITLASGANFQNGDGLTIQGCGATVSLSTPAAPTVVPSILTGPPGENLTTAAVAGATQYSYKVVAIDRFGGFTAASPATTTNTGLVSLGLQTVAITSSSLANDVLSVTTGAGTSLVAGGMVSMTGSTNTIFDGVYQIATSGNPFTITGYPDDSRALGLLINDTTSGTGGTAAYYTSNHITWTAVAGAWKYCIYGGPGNVSFPLIGQSKPTGYHNNYQDLAFDDLGTTYLGNQNITDCPASVPAAAQNDQLTTTIVSGGGTNTIVVANAASQTAAAQTTYIDQCPSILAAAATVANGQGGILIPSTLSTSNSYFVNSFCSLPASSVEVYQAGRMRLQFSGDVELQSTTMWNGNWSTAGGAAPSWGSGTGATVTCDWGPCFYVSGQNSMIDHVLMNSSSANGNTLVLIDSAPFSTLSNSGFIADTGSGNDFYAMPIVVRDTSCTENWHYFTSVGVHDDQSTSFTPGIYIPTAQTGASPCANGYSIVAQNIGLNGHAGFGFNISGGNYSALTVNGATRQGGKLPLVMSGSNNGGSLLLDLKNTLQDTESQPTSAALGTSVNGIIQNMNGSSPGANSRIYSGTRPASLSVQGQAGRLGARNACSVQATSFNAAGPYNAPAVGTNGFSVCAMPMIVNGGYSFGATMGIPSAATTSGPSAGGALTSGLTYSFAVGAVDYAGSWSTAIVATGSCTTNPGNQTCTVSWTNPLGSKLSNLWWCTSGCTLASGNPNPANWVRSSTTTGVTGNTINITSLNTVTHDLPDTNMAILSGLNTNNNWSPTYVSPETTAPTGLAAFDLLYADSTAHQWKTISNNGTADLVGDAIVENCGATSGATQNCAKTRQLNPLIIFGDVQLNTAATQSITTLPFTSAASYSCTGSDLTTTTGSVFFNTYAAASVTIGENGGVNTDHLRYVCIGF